jgi:hypothetical protein
LARKFSASARSSETAFSTACDPSSMVPAEARVLVEASVTLARTLFDGASGLPRRQAR